MVNIYLNIEDRQVLALSIPIGDIERLSLRPVKWLRFVTFAICGVRGHLSATPNGPPVDYSISLDDDIAESYYYTPDGDYHIIDYHALNDRITSSEQTLRASNFRSIVMARDGHLCVFTGVSSSSCDAAHLLPKSKGNEYIGFVLQDRLNLYDSPPECDSLTINSVENGIFLSKNLHASFAVGENAFLKTPNFALDTTDIPRVEADPMPPHRITLHHLEPDTSLYPIPQCDARIPVMAISPPSTVILDYMYGVAAYRRWGSGKDIQDVMQDRFDKHYKSIPIPSPSPPSGDVDDSSESDNPDDDDYIFSSNGARVKNHSLRMSDGMLRAMDNILRLSMLLKGTTPELIAKERQKQEEAEELRAKEASRVKVEQWMQSSLSDEFR